MFVGSKYIRPKKIMSQERYFNTPDSYHWREVFAWLPVRTISGKWIWLKKVYKQKFWSDFGGNFHIEPEVEYAEFSDIMKEKYDN